MYRIYRINFIPDPTQFYVGSTTKKLKDRWQNHLKTYLSRSHCNMPLYKFMRDRDVTDFEIKEIECEKYVDQKQKLIREQYWIDTLKPT